MDNSGKSVFGLDQNVAAGLAYLPVCLVHFVVSIGILATDRNNKLPRFHAVQSLLITASIIIGYVVMFIAMAIIMVLAAGLDIPAFAVLGIFVYVIFFVYVIALFIGLVISMIKGFQGQIFKLPVIGNMADKWSN